MRCIKIGFIVEFWVEEIRELDGLLQLPILQVRDLRYPKWLSEQFNSIHLVRSSQSLKLCYSSVLGNRRFVIKRPGESSVWITKVRQITVKLITINLPSLNTKITPPGTVATWLERTWKNKVKARNSLSNFVSYKSYFCWWHALVTWRLFDGLDCFSNIGHLPRVWYSQGWRGLKYCL